MGVPTVNYEIIPDSYSISGDVRSGYRAQVKCLLAWADAFLFADQIFGATQATIVGPVSWTLPWRFPVTNANLYVTAFSIKPVGVLDNPTSIPNKGLKPGEYYKNAIATVDFGTPPYTQQVSTDDPKNLQQLDPNNPITMCEQSVKITGRMETRKAGSYLFSAFSPVTGDFGVVIPESNLVLSFPRIPYLPWQLVQPFIGSLNDATMLGCAKGTLMLTGMDTKEVATSQGLGQSLQLEYAFNSLGDWNMLPKPDGTYALVYKLGGTNTDANRIYKYMNHLQIFSKINYV
jgi:hypothetical protein